MRYLNSIYNTQPGKISECFAYLSFVMHSYEAMVFDPWNYLNWQNIEDSELKNEYKSLLSI